MSSSPERLRQVRALFDAVIDLEPSLRATELQRLAPDDVALRQEVEALVLESEQTHSVLNSPISALRAESDALAASIIGSHLGPYRVIRLIGMGGMGAVYEAERADAQYHKRVAIKIVQRDIEAEAALVRFRRERQILASLEHRNIATMLDGGVTADGRPYLVMEYVDGAPITTWCNSRTLGVRDRLGLFRQVCAAVHHAHKNLVIHRDLKPGNILVTTDGTVKLLDFGIATLLRTDDDDAMPATRGTARSFTPEYASPEQIRGDVLSTASDIYSIGVVLFELLAGRRPHQFRSRALIDIERVVLHENIPRPSSVVTVAAAEQAGDRSADRLARRLRGDLDSVALMALRTEAARRYSSVETLGDDVRRYLADLPVRAQRDRSSYRLRKFVARNTTATIAFTLTAFALVGGVVTTTLQSRRARVEEQKAQSINTFLTTLLSSVAPGVGHRDIGVAEVLDSAARRIQQDTTISDAVRAPLETVIGRTYYGLGRTEDAGTHYALALQLARRDAGAASAEYVSSLVDIGQFMVDRGNLDSADHYLSQALAIRIAHPRNVPDTLYASLLSDLGSVAHDRGHAAESERLHRAALAIQQRDFGPDADIVAQSMLNVSVTLGEQGRMADAETMVRQALAILDRTHPGPTVLKGDAFNLLASTTDFEHDNVEADSFYRAALDIRRRLLGPKHPDYTYTLFNYSMFILDQGRYQEAAEYARQILALRGAVLPESHPSVAASLQTLGRALDLTGDPVGGERALRESLALRVKYVGLESWQAASSYSILGEHFVRLRDYPVAEQNYLQARGIFARVLGDSNMRSQLNLHRMDSLYTLWGRPEKAAAVRALFVTSIH